MMNLLNLTLTKLLLKSNLQLSPLFIANSQKTSILYSTFSYFASPILYSNNANLKFNYVYFTKFLETPIKIVNTEYNNNVYSDSLIIDKNESCSITQCLFNDISSEKGNGAIEFKAIPLNVVISACSFYKCKSKDQNGCFELNFMNSNNFSILISSSCFFECSTLKQSTLFTITGFTTIKFANNLICENEKNNENSKSYLITMNDAKTIQTIYNNFTHNHGNLFTFDSISSKSNFSLCTIMNNTCHDSIFIQFLNQNHFEIQKLNIYNNNLNHSIFLSAESSLISISSIIFLKNRLDSLIEYGTEDFFLIRNSIFDVNPNIADLDESNVVLGDGNETSTLAISHLIENSCPKFATNSSHSGFAISSTILLASFSLVVVAILISGVVIYFTKKKRPNFLTIAEIPDGYEKIYDV